METAREISGVTNSHFNSSVVARHVQTSRSKCIIIIYLFLLSKLCFGKVVNPVDSLLSMPKPYMNLLLFCMQAQMPFYVIFSQVRFVRCNTTGSYWRSDRYNAGRSSPITKVCYQFQSPTKDQMRVLMEICTMRKTAVSRL